VTDDLDNLKTKLDAADHEADRVDIAHASESAVPSNSNMTGDAMRLAIDLVAAVMIGGLVGYFADQWLGTTPWFLLIFLILGVAAGFRNFYVFAGNLLRPTYKKD